ncbi:MAG TPA: HEAT repeat domain-containing protein [Polyangiaceae bacterium]|nr:HEAT repeat domain-containing protein [Polyangiaceae bacterium]
MFSPSPLPRNLEASFRDLGSQRVATRVSAIRDVVRHSLRSDVTRARAIPELEKALREDPSADVRVGAAVALADVAAREALAVLLVAVEDEDANVRQMALSALGEIADPRAAPRLERALSDDRPEVRYQAVIAFARVAKDDGAAVATALARALDDPDGAIRYIAMRVAEERLAIEADSEPLRAEAMAASAEQLVDDPDDALAVVSALYLARLGRPRGRAIVLDVVAERRGTPELEDEQACVELAGELPLDDAIPHLERRAWGARRVVRALLSWGAGDGASCAWHARIALARMGHERARAEILADLASWRRETREAAVVAAGRARIREARNLLESLGESVDAALVREALVRLAV